MANDVLAREPDEILDDRDEFVQRVWQRFAYLAAIEQLSLAVLEHGVVEIELRLEIRIQRGLAEIDTVSEIAKRDAVETVASGQRPRIVDDPGATREPVAKHRGPARVVAQFDVIRVRDREVRVDDGQVAAINATAPSFG